MASLGEFLINCIPPPFGTLLLAHAYKNKFRNSMYHYASIGSVVGGLLSTISLSIALQYLYPVSYFIRYPEDLRLLGSTRLLIALLVLATIIVSSAWMGRMLGFYFGCSKTLPEQPRNKWKLLKAAYKFAWVEIFPEDSYKFFNAISTDQQNTALYLLDQENMLKTEARRLLYFQLITTRPNDSDQRIQTLIKLKQRGIELTDNETRIYFQTYTSFQSHPIKGLIQLVDAGTSWLTRKDKEGDRAQYIANIAHDEDVTLLLKIGRSGPGIEILESLVGAHNGVFIKKALIRLLSEPSPCSKQIFYYGSGYSQSYLFDYLKCLKNYPHSAQDTVAVLIALENEKILSEGRSSDYWDQFLQADWKHSKGLREGTVALATAGLLHKRNSANFSILCLYSEFSQEIASEIKKIIQRDGYCTQKNYDQIIKQKILAKDAESVSRENSLSPSISSLIRSVTQCDSPIYNSMQQATSLSDLNRTAPADFRKNLE